MSRSSSYFWAGILLSVVSSIALTTALNMDQGTGASIAGLLGIVLGLVGGPLFLIGLIATSVRIGMADHSYEQLKAQIELESGT